MLCGHFTVGQSIVSVALGHQRPDVVAAHEYRSEESWRTSSVEYGDID